MQPEFAIITAQTDIPQVRAARRYEAKNWSALKTKERPRKKSPLLKTTTENKDQIMDQNNGREAKISKEEITITIMMDLQENSHTLSEFSSIPNFAYGNNHPNNGGSYEQRPNQSFNRSDWTRSPNGSFNNQNGIWWKNGNFSRSPSTQRRDFSQNSSYHQPGSDQPNNSTSRRSDNRPTTGLTHYQQKLPKDKNQTSSNMVRFITTDATGNELSDLWLLNYWGLRTQKPTKLETPGLASISSTLPRDPPKKLVVWRLNSCWIEEHLAQSSITEPFGKSVSYSTRLPFKKVPKWQRLTQDKRFLWSFTQL